MAPAAISAELRKVHQYLTFSVNTPAQLALADMLRSEPEHIASCLRFIRLVAMCWSMRSAAVGWRSCRAKALTFCLPITAPFPILDDVNFCQWLTKEVGVAAIPLSVFCADPFPHKLIRLCFAKQESTLLAAAERFMQAITDAI